jgi:hypothetical protein
VDHVDSVQESLSATILGDSEIDENELLKELEGLTLQDSQGGWKAPVTATTSASSSKTPKPEVPITESNKPGATNAPDAEPKDPKRVLLPG